MISLIATERERGRERGSVVRMEGDYGQMEIVRRSAEAYEAAIKNDWDKLKKLCEDDSSITSFPMTLAGNTALHIAVYSGDVEWVKALLKLAPVPGPNDRGDTVLHEAAAVGNVEMARVLLIEYGTELLESKNKRGETPLFRAAAFKQAKMVRFLASKAKDMTIHRTRNDGTSILHMTVLNKNFGKTFCVFSSWALKSNFSYQTSADTAIELVLSDSVLVDMKDESNMTCFQLLANMPSAFKSGIPMNMLEELLYLCMPHKYVTTFNN
jgi:ankyrin repeat protein